MSCTTILVGKKATYDGSTFTARIEDSGSGSYTPKKFVYVKAEEQPKLYKSVISHVEIPLDLPAMGYTAMPNASDKNGVWGAAGVNSANVSMTATETITTNNRVLAADPLVVYQPAANGKPEVAGGIGEEDMVTLTLPYIHSAREGVERLGALLEKYGTYEMNGIAFQDVDEIWWLETIGGHHWMAVRVDDEKYVVMPNQLGIDSFDFQDAYGAQKNHMCCKDLKDFVRTNHLDLSLDGKFNPRLAFGSHTDSDHVYNTPRAWFIERYFSASQYKWDGEGADYQPWSDDLPFSMIPDHKITVEEMKYALSSHYQGTPYDPYGKGEDPARKGLFRPVGVDRNCFLSLVQIRPYLPESYRTIEWLCFGSNVFNAFVPQYVNIDQTPAYFRNTTEEVNSTSFYWANRLIGALADHSYTRSLPYVERYQQKVPSACGSIILKYDRLAGDKADPSLLEKANEEIAQLVRKQTDALLAEVLHQASLTMKNYYGRSDA